MDSDIENVEFYAKNEGKARVKSMTNINFSHQRQIRVANIIEEHL